MHSFTANTFRAGRRSAAAGLLKDLESSDTPDKPVLLWGKKQIELPEEVIPLLSFALQAMSRGQGVSLITRPEFLTTHEAAEMIACSRQHVVDLIKEGKLKGTKIGTHRRIKLDDLLKFIELEDRERDAVMSTLVAHTEEIGGYDLK